MKNIIKICVFSLLVSLVSCGIAPINSGIISELNTSTSLKEFKDEYDIHQKEDLVSSKTIKGVKYTSIILYRLTQYETETYQTSGGYNQNNGMGYGGNSYTPPETETIEYFTLTPFYLVFKENNLYFMGYRYEAKNHPNKSQLIKIIGEETDEIFHRR